MVRTSPACLLLHLLAVGALVPAIVPANKEESPEYWKRLADDGIDRRMSQVPNVNKARNVILFLGDGMSITTVTAGRILKGQLEGKSGEEGMLEFDRFPHLSLSKTFALDKQVSDSASTATAYLCGVKANYGTIGVDGRVAKPDCPASKDPSTHVSSILQWSQDKGKATGIVTTTRVTHATPAGAYAHVADRDWEGTSPDPEGCPDIAWQLIHTSPGKDIKVIMGGGRSMFFPVNATDMLSGKPGKRSDNRHLIEEWAALRNSRYDKAAYVNNKFQLDSVDPETTDYLLGLFNNDHLNFILDSDEVPLNETEPSLAEMTTKAIQILQKEPKGFFLLVEGGRIDMAHHESKAKKALFELLEFEKAIKAALELTDEQETLIVVTADHSHTLTLSGYPKRGENIFGFAGVSSDDKLVYTSLSYANGPGYVRRNENLTLEEVTDNNYTQNSAVPLNYETHGGDDVAVYARGPWAHLFSGVHDQTYIARVMAHSACLLSDREGRHCPHDHSGGGSRQPPPFLWTSLLAFLAFICYIKRS